MDSSKLVIVEAVSDFAAGANPSLRNAFSFKRGTQFLLNPAKSVCVNEWLCVQLLSDPRKFGYVPVSFVRVTDRNYNGQVSSATSPPFTHFQRSFERPAQPLRETRSLYSATPFVDDDAPLPDEQLPPRDYDSDSDSPNPRTLYESSRAILDSSPPSSPEKPPRAAETSESLALKSALHRELTFEARRGFPSVQPRNELEEALEKLERRKRVAHSEIAKLEAPTRAPPRGQPTGLSSPRLSEEFRAALQRRNERLSKLEATTNAGDEKTNSTS